MPFWLAENDQIHFIGSQQKPVVGALLLCGHVFVNICLTNGSDGDYRWRGRQLGQGWWWRSRIHNYGTVQVAALSISCVYQALTATVFAVCSKSSRATCSKCSEKIMKDEVRLGLPKKWGGGIHGYINCWQHLTCTRIPDPDTFDAKTSVFAFSSLDEEDQKKVVDELKK